MLCCMLSFWDPIQETSEKEDRTDFTDINRTIRTLTVMHTARNFAEKELNYLFLFFNVAYDNVPPYFLLFLLSFLIISSSLS